MADVGEEAAARLVDFAQGFVRLAQFLGALRYHRLEIGMRVLQRLLMRLQVGRHAIEALAEMGELVAPGNVDAVGEIALGQGPRAA